MFNLNDFPDIVLLKIFGFMRFGELCRVKQVCKKWYQLAKSRPLTKIVDASDVVLHYHPMVKLVQRLASTVTTLHVMGTLQRMLLTPMLLRQMEKQCPMLNTLIIESAFVSKDCTTSDVSLEDFPTQITTLSLRKSFFLLEQLIVAKTSLPQIICLDLSYSWSINEQSHIFLNRLPYLQELYLSNCDSDTNLKFLISKMPLLKVLDLEATERFVDLVETIADSCQKLQKLFLGQVVVTDRDVMQLRLPELHELCLRKTQLSDLGFSVILSNRMPLTWLNIGNTLVSENMVQAARLKYPQCNFVTGISKQKNGANFYCNHFITKVYTGKTSY